MNIVSNLQFASAATGHGTAVSFAVTLLFAGLLLLMILALAFEEKLHCKKSLITGLAAVLVLPLADAFGLLPLGPLTNVFGEKLQLPVFIQGVDWEVITIILGCSVFVDVISQSGLFSWIAIKLTKHSGGDPKKLLIYYGILTVVFSALLNNVTAIIIIGSLTAVSLEKLNLNDKLAGFLLVEGLLTNIGGLLTLISSVPNIIVGNIAGITFLRFFAVSAPYVVVATAVTLWMGARLFKIHSFTEEAERVAGAELVASFDENDGVSGKRFFYGSAVMFALLIGCFAFASLLPLIRDLHLGYVAISFALFALLAFKHEVNRFYSAVDWDLVGFFVFLFVVINVMEHAHVLAWIGSGIGALIGEGGMMGQVSLLWSSAVASSVTDNIPLAAVLSKVLVGFTPPTPSDSALWWSVIFGANLGGNLTPIGSASTLVAVGIMHKHKIQIGFGQFVVQALPFALVQLVLASVYILLL